MLSEASPKPSVARLLASWFSFTRWTFCTCAAQVQDLTEGGADRIKDSIMDLGCEAADDRAAGVALLPPLEPGPFVAALREEIERTLARAIEVINEEPGGDWTPRTEEQVLALFGELGQAALAHALDLRVGSAEALLPAEPATPGGWLHRYRRMLASEGRWPTTESADLPCQSGSSAPPS